MRFEVKSLGMGTVHPRLAKHIKLRLKGLDGGHPLAQKRLVGVKPGIHAERVELSLLDPPEAVLNQVASAMRVASVDVGHGTHKPTVHLPLAVVGRCIGIKQGLVTVNRSKGGSLFTAGLGPRIGSRRRRPGIEPAGVRRALVEVVPSPHMVKYHVFNRLHFASMQAIDPSQVVTMDSVAGVNSVVVRNRIAVVACHRHVVLQQGHRPNRRHAQ